jgi:hypothetical protein
MPNVEVLELFKDYKTLQQEIRNLGVSMAVDDLKTYYPDVYVALEAEFKKRDKIKQLGVLLAGPVRREGS